MLYVVISIELVLHICSSVQGPDSAWLKKAAHVRSLLSQYQFSAQTCWWIYSVLQTCSISCLRNLTAKMTAPISISVSSSFGRVQNNWFAELLSRASPTAVWWFAQVSIQTVLDFRKRLMWGLSLSQYHLAACRPVGGLTQYPFSLQTCSVLCLRNLSAKLAPPPISISV